jgi:hypothetical protein
MYAFREEALNIFRSLSAVSFMDVVFRSLSRATFHCKVLAKHNTYQSSTISNRVNRIDRLSSAYSTTPSVMVEKPWNGSVAD